MKLLIDIELAQAIINYLQTKPYVEVQALIERLLRLEKTPTLETNINNEEK